MKKHQRARILAELISPYLYSIASPPKALNQLFLSWISTGIVPDMGAILEAKHSEAKEIK